METDNELPIKREKEGERKREGETERERDVIQDGDRQRNSASLMWHFLKYKVQINHPNRADREKNLISSMVSASCRTYITFYWA